MAGGVCCNVACPSDCYACTVALGATADGQCTSLADGTACSLGTCQAAACKAPVDAGIDGAAPVVDASVADAARDATTDASADAEPDATTAMTSKDATVDAPAHDAGAPHDGAVAETGAAASEDSGDTGDFTRTPPSCSCRTAGGRTTSSTPFFAAVLFVGAVVARRRTRAAAPSGPSRRPRGAAVAWLVLLVVSLGGRSARADDDAQNKASARALATAGFEAFRAEHWAEAADRFSRAESLVHAPAHLLYLARSYGHLGKLVAAHETYEKLTRETLPDTAPQAARHAQEDGAKELGALEAHLPKLVVTVAPAPPGLTVEMDGARLSSAVLGVAIPVDPGQHTLVAKADGFAPAERSVDAADGVRTVVALSMEALSSTPPVAAGTPGPALANPPPLPEKDATASSGGGLSALRVAGIVSLVVAAGAGGAGAFFAIQSHDNRAQGDQLCMPNGCMKVNEDQINDFDNKATLYGELAVASFITAGAAAAFGVTALVLPQHGSSSEPKAALWVGPTSIGVRGSF
jgi:MYXO-CTERM domain-containing protein